MSKRSQLIELFFHVGEHLGHTTDRDLARLADVTLENVANWRNGAVKELKTQTLRAIKEALATQLQSLRRDLSTELNLVPLEIEFASSPSALQRQFVDRMAYDYLGHRFLYFEPQGALAWENLIREGYGQDVWLASVEQCLASWLDLRKDGQGQPRGVLAQALGLGRRRGRPRGIDVISLGPGEGGKEVIVLRELQQLQQTVGQRLPWTTLALVDVSIPLLLTAARAAYRVQLAGPDELRQTTSVLPFSADFEEGELGFARRLPTGRAGEARGRRLVLLLGNVLGNLRHEARFLRQKLDRLVRGGDLLWVEVGLRPDNIEDDPVFQMTRTDHEATAAFTNRIRLLEGPYRRWEAALGRPASELRTRIWLREDDETCPVPGSINFCHDLVINDERRVCTMLYSRRYQRDELCRWWEAQGFAIQAIVPVRDSRGVQRTVHLLLQRR